MINLIPLVSVCLQTYMHEKYISECLEGILMQKTSFAFEVILGEDDSSDCTRAICKQYASKYPDKIRLFLRDRKDVIYINSKVTGRFNFVENLKASRGKYIAICEGDDYWTDEHKLQKQFDFLEHNEDFGICFHPVDVFYEKDQTIKSDTITRAVDTVSSVLELTNGNFIHTPSVMLRNDFEIPDWFLECPIGDWTLYMVAIRDRKIKKLDDVMAVYRKHNAGIYSGSTLKTRFIMLEGTYSLVEKHLTLGVQEKENLGKQISIFRSGLKSQKFTYIYFEKPLTQVWKKIKRKLNGK